MATNATHHCHFCWLPDRAVPVLVCAADGVCVCIDCVDVLAAKVAEKRAVMDKESIGNEN